MATACQTIPNVKFYAEIPFSDCPEGVYVEAITHKTGFVSCSEWAKMRPYMIMVDPEGKKEIFAHWSKSCRMAGNSCNVPLNSARKTVEAVDSIVGRILK